MSVKWFEHVRRHHIDFTQMNSVIYRKRPGDLPVLGDDIICGMVVCTKSGGGSFEINGFHFPLSSAFRYSINRLGIIYSNSIFLRNAGRSERMRGYGKNSGDREAGF